MTAFKSSKQADRIREWQNSHSQYQNEALQKARVKAEKDIFKQKVVANLIVGVALIIVFCLLYW